MAMLAQKIGRNIIPVVEKYTELDLILEYAEKVGVRPTIGMRVKLAARGGGRWQSSGGYRSKFGLTVGEILKGLEELKTRGMEDCFQLLHFHLGSQIPNIRIVKGALNEAARVYVELVKAGAGLKYMDVGGGLGVDYDGSQTNFESSVNYTLQEYANDVVYHLQTVCDEAKVPHPTIISESGRAIVAHHSLLVFNVLGVSGLRRRRRADDGDAGHGAAAHRPDRDLRRPDAEERARELSRRAAGARHGDEPVLRRLPAARAAVAGREPLLGDLRQAAEAGAGRWTKCRRTCRTSTSRCRTPTSATSRCSSRFPTAGRSSSCFPIMPIHRLNERPTRHAVLGDITCDSDGKIDQFIDRRDVKRTLPLHAFDGSPYYLGVFLVGAYQEILGDLHNLLGDTHAVHVSLDANNAVVLDAVIKGDTVQEVLDYVEFDAEALMTKLRTDVEAAVRAGRARLRGSRAGCCASTKTACTATPTWNLKI